MIYDSYKSRYWLECAYWWLERAKSYTKTDYKRCIKCINITKERIKWVEEYVEQGL